MRIVVSLGHGALDAGVGVLAHAERFRGVLLAAQGIHALLDRGHEVVVTHAHEHPAPDTRVVPGSPDERDMATQEARADGVTGYLLEQALRNITVGKRSFATLVTHTLVDERDSAFLQPTRPVGPALSESEAKRFERTRHWRMVADGEHWRRTVPTPDPLTVLQSEAISALLTAGHTVLCSGGGIAVKRDVQGHQQGVDALVDADLGASLIAREINADTLLLATDVPCVYENWGTPEQHQLRRLSVATLEPAGFEAHTIRPKLEAASRLVAHGGHAVIGALGDLPELMIGRAGTTIEY